LFLDQGVGNVTGATSVPVLPAATTTYTLTAASSGGSVSRSVIVTVNKPVISSFTANPSKVSAGGSTTLSWNVSGGSSLSIDQGVGTVTGTSVTVGPISTATTYTLTATNTAGSSTTSVSVPVQIPRAKLILQ